MATPGPLDLPRFFSDKLEHSKHLGMELVSVEKGRVVLRMPYSQKIVGDPREGLVHGGAITALLDTACGGAAISAGETAQIAPTLDLRVDYVRPGVKDKDIFADCHVLRLTRSVIFVRGTAYQDSIDRPIAFATANFMQLEESVNAQMIAAMADMVRGA